jgi:hypothetical protein
MIASGQRLRDFCKQGKEQTMMERSVCSTIRFDTLTLEQSNRTEVDSNRYDTQCEV